MPEIIVLNHATQQFDKLMMVDGHAYMIKQNIVPSTINKQRSRSISYYSIKQQDEFIGKIFGPLGSIK